jgi:methyl-accepting chemotaxis protein
VVASEVKNLAAQTARATEEISGQITQIRSATKEAVDAIGSITGTIEGISGIATTIAAAVGQQGSATAAIGRTVQQTAQATRDVTGHITGVSQSASDTGAAAERVLHESSELSAKAAVLTSKVNQFVAGVRAA